MKKPPNPLKSFCRALRKDECKRNKSSSIVPRQQNRQISGKFPKSPSKKQKKRNSFPRQSSSFSLFHYAIENNNFSCAFLLAQSKNIVLHTQYFYLFSFSFAHFMMVKFIITIKINNN